jgi:AraC-like DNA-binding protein
MAFVEFLREKKYNMMNEVHVHPWHEIYYLKKGRTRYLVDDEIYPVEDGNLVFIPKGHYHMTDSGYREMVERVLLSFDDELFDSDTAPLLDELMDVRLISIPMHRLEGLDALIEGMEEALKLDGSLGEATRKIYALATLSYICRYKRDFTPKVSEADRIVHEVAEYVSSHYADELSLATLAHRFSLSESHLSRRFKAVAGMGLNEYITHVRILNAERLLTEGNTSITAVAVECGFNDSNYFSTVFKKQKGVTPLKFAKSVGK